MFFAFFVVLTSFIGVFSLSTDIYISNLATSSPTGTQTAPFPTVFSAFQFAKSTFSTTATASDEFHFKIIPSTNQTLNTYIMDDSEINSDVHLFDAFLGIFFSIFSPFRQFKNFVGKIFIESAQPPLIPILEWQCPSFAFKILTSLTIQNVMIDGSSIHVNPRSSCPASPMPCCASAALYNDSTSICLLKNVGFKLTASWFSGLIILNGATAANLTIFNSNITNFYALTNYYSLISDVQSNANINISYMALLNVFFVHGLQVQNGGGFISISNVIFLNWNAYQPIPDHNGIKFLNSQTASVIIACSQCSNVSFSNISLYQTYTDFGVYLTTSSNLTSNFLNIVGFQGRLFFVSGNSYISLCNVNIDGLVYLGLSIPAFIELDWSGALMNNSQLSNMIGVMMKLVSPSLVISDMFVTNLLDIASGQSPFIWVCCVSDGSVVINRLNATGIQDYSSSFINEEPVIPTFEIHDSIFQNFNFTSGAFAFLISWSNMMIDNVTFQNIECSFAIFMEAATHGSGRAYLKLNHSRVVNISADIYGPMSVLTAGNAILYFENSIIQDLQCGIATFLPTPNQNYNFFFYNVTFSRINLKSGYFMLLLTTYSVNLTNCTWEDFYLKTAAPYRILFRLEGADAECDYCIFRNLTFLNGNGELFDCQNVNLIIRNSVFEYVTMQGKGGISFSGSGNLLFVSSHYRHCSNQDDGPINIVNAGIVTINDSIFQNVSSFRYALFYVEGFQNMSINNCSFQNLAATFEKTAFYIVLKNPTFNTSQIVFNNNLFQQNSALTSNSGTLAFISDIPILLFNNTFDSAFAEEGGFIYANEVVSLKILECTFKNAFTLSNAGGLYLNLIGQLEIINCSFFNNTVGMGIGANIYLENSNFTLKNCKFNGSVVNFRTKIQHGSAIYAFLSEDSYFLTITNCSFFNLSQEAEVIFVSTNLKTTINYQNLLFQGINSMNGNGIMTCTQCIGSVNMVSIIECNVTQLGNMIEFKNYNSQRRIDQDSAIQLTNVTMINNVMTLSGYFLSFYQVKSITLTNLSLRNNSLQNHFAVINTYKYLSILEFQSSNDSLFDQFSVTKSLFQLLNGHYIDIRSAQIKNSTCLFSSISTLMTAMMQDIIVQNNKIAISDDYFISFFDTQRLNLSNINVSDSIISTIVISSIYLQIGCLNFFNVNLTTNLANGFTQIGMIYASSSTGMLCYVSDISLQKVSAGFVFDSFKKAVCTNLISQNNELSGSKSILTFNSILEIQISNSSFDKTLEGAALIISSSDQTLGIIRIANISISSSGSRATGAINITGGYDFLFKNLSFSGNQGFPGSAFNYYTLNQKGTFTMEDCSFSTNETGYIIIPNNDYWLISHLIIDDFVRASALNLSSFAWRMRTFINDDEAGTTIEYLDGELLRLYSGQQIDFQFVSIDDFGNLSPDVDQMTVVISQNHSSNLILSNNKGVFSSSTATLISFAIYVDPHLIPNETFPLTVNFGGQRVGGPIDIVGGYDFNIIVRIKPCDRGHYLVNNACLTCPEGTYSFDEKPTNATMCSSCPENGKCLKGDVIIPSEGFWNDNPQDTVIFKCENSVACQQGCTEGYFGYVCHECDKGYGKTLLGTCVKCDDSYLQFHILRACFKWLLLGALCFYQYLIIRNLHDQTYRVLLSQINIFIYHSLLYAMNSQFQQGGNESLQNFYETQSVFSYLENNLFMVYCMFKDYRDYSFYFVIFMYFLLIPIFQTLFIVGFHFRMYIASRKTPRQISLKEFGENVVENVCLLFFNNFITLFYYFVGLVFYFDVNSEISVAFPEIGLSTFEFYFLFFLSFMTILLLFWVPTSLLLKKQSKKRFLLIVDCEYKEGHKKLCIAHFICLFFAVILSQYSSVGYVFARFVRNMFMLYLGLLVSFQSFVNEEVHFLKIFSIIAIICSMIQDVRVNMTVNATFYVVLVVFILKNIHLAGKI